MKRYLLADAVKEAVSMMLYGLGTFGTASCFVMVLLLIKGEILWYVPCVTALIDVAALTVGNYLWWN